MCLAIETMLHMFAGHGISRVDVGIFLATAKLIFTQSRRIYGCPAKSIISGGKGKRLGRYRAFKKVTDGICANKVCSCFGPGLSPLIKKQSRRSHDYNKLELKFFLMHILFLIVLSLIAGLVIYAIYQVGIAPRFNPLQILAGPPTRSLFKTHLNGVLEYVDSILCSFD